MDVSYELDGNRFVWDPRKAHANRRKHSVTFEEAATVFFDPLFVLTDASRNAEARDAAIGFTARGRLLCVVHVEMAGDHIRIVSARPASPAEEAFYAH